MADGPSGRILELVRRIAARPPPLRVVSPEEFRAITCNRCGACCEEIYSPDEPEALDAEADNPALSDDRRRFLTGLIPVRPLTDGWLYRCRHFGRDPEGAGVCAIYEDRPTICRAFPGGRPVLTWPQCSWYVEIQDGRGEEVFLLNSGDGEVAGAEERSNEPKEVRDE